MLTTSFEKVLKVIFRRNFSKVIFHRNDSLSPHLFTWSDMLDAIFSIKVGKATSTFVKAEHIFCGSPELLCYLHLLYNGLLSHSYMPHEFLCGTISPIIKDPNGDSTCSNNYRGITLGPILLQVFEYLLLHKFGHHLDTSNLQFGFKRSHSTAHSVFVLREVVNYYTTHGSNVLVGFLDCSKAFDSVALRNFPKIRGATLLPSDNDVLVSQYEDSVHLAAVI